MSAVEREVRGLFVNADKVRPSAESDYAFLVTDSRDRVWYATSNYYCRRVLATDALRFGESKNGDEVLIERVKVIIEGEETDSHFTAINVSALEDAALFGAMYMSATRYHEEEVDEMVDELTAIAGVNTDLPVDSKTEISRVEYLIAIKKLIKQSGEEAGILMIDRKTDTIIKATNIALHSSFYGDYLLVEGKATMMFGNGLTEVEKSGQVWAPRFSLENTQFVPATPQDIAQRAEAGKALFAKYVAEEGFVHVLYEGNTYNQGYNNSRISRYVKSRSVVDPKGCQRFDTRMFNSLLELEGVELVTNESDESTDVQVPSDVQFSQIVPFLVLYDLTAGRWGTGLVLNAKAVEFRKDAFSKVVMPESRKRLVRALATYHNTEGANIDIIAGKGGGNIFLLDGAPGTGKTLTAEATAEELEHVLFKVSLGELGSSVEKLESALDKILSLAERWNAVLLIDEADVFLEKRTSENLARNAVVAVFLRKLEYFEGLLFLTTNRGDNLDEAFLSRVTLGLHFRKPDEDGQTAIWNGLLKNAGIKLVASDIASLVKFGVNGREIKNAINTARALAALDRVPVSFKHIDEILRTRQQFFDEVKTSQRG